MTRNEVDTLVAQHLTAQAQQQIRDHLTTHGHMPQLTEAGLKPADQTETNPACCDNIPAGGRLDNYQSADGWGVVLVLKAEESGTEFVKSIGFGPEADERTHGWQEVVDAFA